MPQFLCAPLGPEPCPAPYPPGPTSHRPHTETCRVLCPGSWASWSERAESPVTWARRCPGLPPCSPRQPHSPASASPNTRRSSWPGWAPASSGAPAALPGEAPASVAAATGLHTRTAWGPPGSAWPGQPPALAPAASPLVAQTPSSPQGLAPGVLEGEPMIGERLLPDRPPCAPNRARPQLAGLRAKQGGSEPSSGPGAPPGRQQWGAPCLRGRPWGGGAWQTRRALQVGLLAEGQRWGPASRTHLAGPGQQVGFDEGVHGARGRRLEALGGESGCGRGSGPRPEPRGPRPPPPHLGTVGRAVQGAVVRVKKERELEGAEGG